MDVSAVCIKQVWSVPRESDWHGIQSHFPTASLSLWQRQIGQPRYICHETPLFLQQMVDGAWWSPHLPLFELGRWIRSRTEMRLSSCDLVKCSWTLQLAGPEMWGRQIAISFLIWGQLGAVIGLTQPPLGSVWSDVTCSRRTVAFACKAISEKPSLFVLLRNCFNVPSLSCGMKGYQQCQFEMIS